MEIIKSNIAIVIIILVLILSTQISALFILYKEKRTYRGIGYWFFGNFLMGLGIILMLFVRVEGLDMIARIANPVLILGHLFLYIGVKRFFDKKLQTWIPISIFGVFLLSYYYNMFYIDNVSARTILIALTIALISLMIGFEFLSKEHKLRSITIKFNALVFFINAFYYILRIFRVLNSSYLETYIDQESYLLIGFMFSIVITNLWTFGFIMIINHRLNVENKLEKEKLELVFNTSLDAQIITRLSDGLIVNVNDELARLIGYAKKDIIGNNINSYKFWTDLNKKEFFLKELREKGICRSMETSLEIKENQEFYGMISARKIEIEFETHIITLIRDITNRIKNEERIQELINKLEIERNAAQLSSITDGLTGLANRRYLDDILDKEIGRLKRSHGSLTLIMLDIDYFKRFNDTYGHVAGDSCLQMIATSLSTIIERQSDTIARYGGEEFLAVLPDTNKEGAIKLGEEIRKSVEELKIPHIGSDVSKYVSLSIGVSTFYPEDIGSAKEAVALVDKALYSAKEMGRNRYFYLDKEDKREERVD